MQVSVFREKYLRKKGDAEMSRKCLSIMVRLQLYIHRRCKIYLAKRIIKKMLSRNNICFKEPSHFKTFYKQAKSKAFLGIMFWCYF